MPGDEEIAAMLAIAEAFDALGVAWLVCGSMASTTLGLARHTNDADFLVDLDARHVRPLVEILGDAWYADEDALRDAVRRRGLFNAIHLGSMFKIDLYLQRRDPFSVEEMRRRRAIQVTGDPPRFLQFATAEDVILSKLHWFREGGGVSDRQWNDVLGVVKVQDAALDRTYLEHWAKRLDLVESLALALAGKHPRR